MKLPALPVATVVMLAAFSLTARAQNTPPPPPSGVKAIDLFNGTSLANFTTFLRDRGADNDPNHVFSVENGVIHVSGKEFGYILTRQEFGDFYLTAQFKWGDGTFGERTGQARDSGILYDVQGEQKVWPRSVEFQIQEGCTGDFWMTDGAQLTGADGKRVTGPAGSATKIDRFSKGPWTNVAGFRDPVNELEKPRGEWNSLVLVQHNGHIAQYVNGKLANTGTEPFPATGRILFQSEGAEVYFRNIVVYPYAEAHK